MVGLYFTIILIISFYTKLSICDESINKALTYFRWYYSTNEYALNSITKLITIWRKINEFKRFNSEKLEFETLTYKTDIECESSKPNTLEYEISEDNINKLKNTYSNLIYKYYIEIIRDEKDKIRNNYLMDDNINNIRSTYRDEYFTKKIYDFESELIEKFGDIDELIQLYDLIFKNLYEGSSLNGFF